MQIALVLGLLAVVVALFVSERLRPDLVAMLALAALVALRILPTQEALAGFSSPATVTVAAMFVLSAGLQASGLVRYVGDRVLAHGPAGVTGLLLLLLLTIAPISAFINNTAAVVVFLPIVLRVCQGRGIHPGLLLMPMVFLAILGGTCTLIGTSTNILVSSLAAQRGLRPFTMFELSPLGLIFLAVGALYLLTAGRRLLPTRERPAPLDEDGELRDYLSELVVLENSPLAGQTLAQARLHERFGFQVLGTVNAAGEVSVVVDPEHRIEPGGHLLIKARAGALMSLRDATGLALRSARRAIAAGKRSLEAALVEILIVPGSRLEGRTLKELDFRNQHGGTALAIRRPGGELVERVGRIPLRVGDQLLVLAPRANISGLQRQAGDFVGLQEHDIPALRPRHAVLSVAIILGVVVTAALGLLPIAACALIGAVLMVVTGCLPTRRLYDSIDWKVILLLAGVIPLGAALDKSGAAALIVRGMLELVGAGGAPVVLGAFVFLTYLLTGVMSNNATAALMVPLAVGSAEALGVDSRPFLVGIMFAASAAFWTPFGYQTNLLVYAPGGYRFGDYTRVGGPLNLA